MVASLSSMLLVYVGGGGGGETGGGRRRLRGKPIAVVRFLSAEACSGV